MDGTDSPGPQFYVPVKVQVWDVCRMDALFPLGSPGARIRSVTEFLVYLTASSTLLAHLVSVFY